MNKQELITKVAEYTEATKKDVEAFINAFVDVVTESLANREDVNISGFGKFEVRERAGRVGRNPQTGEEIIIPASVAPAFKAGSKLKEAVKGQ